MGILNLQSHSNSVRFVELLTVPDLIKLDNYSTTILLLIRRYSKDHMVQEDLR